MEQLILKKNVAKMISRGHQAMASLMSSNFFVGDMQVYSVLQMSVNGERAITFNVLKKWTKYSYCKHRLCISRNNTFAGILPRFVYTSSFQLL